MQRLRVGVMGCAGIAERSMIPAIQALESLALVAVASRNNAKAERFATRFGCRPACYTDLLHREDIDAIYMPLPTGLHEEWIHRALDADKHVLAEKSLAPNFAVASRLIEKAKRKNRLIMENFMFPYHSQHDFVRRLIANGDIGEIRVFRSSFGFPPLDRQNFRYDAALGGGALLDAGAYTIKAAQLYLGDQVDMRHASLHYDPERGVDIYGGALLTNVTGQIAQVAFGFDNFYRCDYEIWGSKGSLRLHRAFTPPPGFKPTLTLEQQDHTQDFTLPADNHFIGLLKEFERAIRNQDYQRHWNEVLMQAALLSRIQEAGAA
jgi:NDP-hexose-3-ketoreductase